MAKIDIFGTEMSVSRTPSWSKKGWTLKRVPQGNSEAQKRAQLALIDIARGARGQKGKVAGLPGAAHAVRTGMSGKNFGGKSESERAQERYEAADATRARLTRELSQ